jgi:hypothetical protein
MNFRRGFLLGYRLLLGLYPTAFRKRFAPEMLQLAESADHSEWPLIFGDTTVAIVRCWFEGTHSTALVPEPNAYLSLGESSVRPSRILQGMVLFAAIVGGVVYINHRWPPPCPNGLFPDPPAPTHIARR